MDPFLTICEVVTVRLGFWTKSLTACAAELSEAAARATRLGEFSPIRLLLTLGSCLEIKEVADFFWVSTYFHS
jgi:hypothetical protein